jgi:hypothetical protein
MTDDRRRRTSPTRERKTQKLIDGFLIADDEKRPGETLVNASISSPLVHVWYVYGHIFGFLICSISLSFIFE